MNRDPDSPLGGDEPLAPGEADAVAALEERLFSERPLPHPGFRSMLRNQLLTDAGGSAMRPAHLRVLIAAYASGGLALLAFAAVGVFGAGPLAA
jgi:hypothetical protein